MNSTTPDTTWEDGLAAVRAYVAENGHARVPRRHVSPDGHGTGEWVRNRRMDYAGWKLSDERVAELETIPGWVWSPLDEQWSAGMDAVRAYVAEHGNAHVPREYVSPDGHRTGRWVTKRRNDYADGYLDGDRIAELESLPGWAWNMLDEQWATGLAAVRAFAAENGHTNIPKEYESPDGFRTGRWAAARRQDYTSGTLGVSRIAELESIPGWVWNQLDGLWAIGLGAVRDYADTHGNARIPASFLSPDGHRTGSWVNSRRQEYAAGTLSADRIAELESLPGWTWRVLDELWSAGVTAVRAFAAEHGHANVPNSYVSPEGHRTGVWVNSRRGEYAAGKLPADRIAELEAIPGWIWRIVDSGALWAAGVAAVRAYAAENADARVPDGHVSPDGHRTGAWVQARRQQYATGSLSADRIAELESLPGWVWNMLDAQWVAGIAAVRAYATKHGHARVPYSFMSPDGHRTGPWAQSRRRDYAAGKLSADRIAELESLPGWAWNTLDTQWTEGLAAVRTYAAETGHARIPYSYESPDGHRTGIWVSARRQEYAAGRLAADRIAELEAIPGWTWNQRDTAWALGVSAVRGFAAENGHARVPASYVSPDGHHTGQWVAQRRNGYATGKLSADRIAELELIPGWSWKVR